ncbi:FAD/NAD(P)-binding protein [Neptunicoccus sediminis]|uniref:FAD/NAD(P)-binding protein n=1 Tax=Neptunicoccus sediminis TaxID=1892596 RepID=UPI000845E2CE|nr:FAD/NAD(P)-binding protein [Neptunicoccus sediminis]
MTRETDTIRIALIGAGPRGLGALEALVARLEGSGTTLDLTLFDDLQLPGAGPNFDPAQTPHSILNIPLRDVDIPPVLSLPCGDFTDWQFDRGHGDGERFPPRAELGDYLMARFRDMTQSSGVAIDVTALKSKASRLVQSDAGWQVRAQDRSYGPFHEVLLIPGQPLTPPDPQWARWSTHAKDTGACVINAYPDRLLLEAAKNWSDRRVGIRGLGLSTFDVIRFLTVGLGGRFEGETYHPSGKEPQRIYAFSLNGKPPFPKPVDAALDQKFDPTLQEVEQFEIAVQEAVAQGPDRALAPICEALLSPVVRIGATLGAAFDAKAVKLWLRTECDSPGDQEDQSPEETLKHGIAMAKGSTPPSVGYCVGQVWRKMQNELRANFNSARMEPETARTIVGFDEGIKRYSYGPPLRSSQELLAVINSGLVSLRVVEDPDIQLVDGGWHLEEHNAEANVSVMIDAVLPPPALEAVSDGLFTQLKSEGTLHPRYEGSGAATAPDGQVVGRDNEVRRGLSMLGRLALGSVIAADSIHDCFGASSDRWAEGVLERRGRKPD